MRTLLLTILLTGCLTGLYAANPNISFEGDTTDRHTMTLIVKGPSLSETGNVNPFTDYRLSIRFQYMLSGAEIYTVPGYFAADGNAGETGADSGNIWKAHFTPQWTGVHAYKISFRTGPNIALSDDPEAGTPVAGIDGDTGSFDFHEWHDNDTLPDFKALGRLDIDKWGNHLIAVADGHSDNPIFLKTGTASPSNFLDYADFDNTPQGAYTKTFTDHVTDWQEGNPTWGNGEKGKGIIGALNYLSSQGVNTIGFRTLTLGEPDSSIYPFVTPSDHTRFDCSKLDQWLTVISHANNKGIAVELRTQTAANQNLLDGGELDTTRMLYYRELIARYAHCLGIIWNLGDNNSQTLEQRIAMANYVHSTDPHKHPSRAIVLSLPEGTHEQAAQPLLPVDSIWITGFSLRSNYLNVHAETKTLVDSIFMYPDCRLRLISSDYQLPEESGVPADGETGTPTQDDIRKYVLWGNLMAKGAGVSYFFGSEADLTCQNFRDYEKLWSYYRHAEDFFRMFLLENEKGVIQKHALIDLTSNDAIISEADGYCLSYDGYEPFVVYLPSGGNAKIDITTTNADDTLRVWWYNPRTGGTLQQGDVITGGNIAAIGTPPSDPTEDWVALIIPDEDGSPVGIQAYANAMHTVKGIPSIAARNGVVRMFIPPEKSRSTIEIITANGKVVASSTLDKSGQVEFRIKTTGVYLVCKKTAGKQSIIARVLNM